MEWRHGDYRISDDPALVDVEVTWGFLRTSYWAKDVPREKVERSIAGSLVLGIYDESGAQVGFARAVSDFALFAWIADVFVLEEHRGQGLGVALIETMVGHPRLAGLRSILLATADAHGLYERFGFRDVEPGRFLVRRERPADRGEAG